MFVVFDIETTGLYESNCDVIEFAYALFDENNNFVQAEQLYFYYEGMSWSEEAYAVHHIPLDFLRTQADKFKENIIKMYTVLNQANVCGHNAKQFDCPFVKRWLLRMGIRNLEYRVIQDTMLAFRPLTHKSRIKLSKLLDMFDITPEYINALLPYWFEGTSTSHAHEAAYDVTATSLLTLKGIERGLIAFEPLVHLNTQISQEDIASMYEITSKVRDPKGFLVRLVDYDESNDQYYLHYVTHDTNMYSSVEPTESDIPKYFADHKYLPLDLMQVAKDSSIFQSIAGDITYRLTRESAGDKFEIIAPYGTFSDTDVDISMIIANNFKEA